MDAPGTPMPGVPVVTADGKWFCDHCERRASKGGLQFQVLGQPTTKHLIAGRGSIYCSERCLRDSLLGLGPHDDPADVLGTRIKELERELQVQSRRHKDDRERLRAHEEAITDALKALGEIHSQELTRSVANDERGKSLRRTLDVVARILGHP